MAVFGLLLVMCTPFGTAIPLSSFYSYGSAAGDSRLPTTDDGSSGAILLPSPFLFFGTSQTKLYVSFDVAQRAIVISGSLIFPLEAPIYALLPC